MFKGLLNLSSVHDWSKSSKLCPKKHMCDFLLSIYFVFVYRSDTFTWFLVKVFNISNLRLWTSGYLIKVIQKNVMHVLDKFTFYHNIAKIWNNVDPKMKVASPPTIWKNEIHYNQNQTWTSILEFLGKRKYSNCKLHALRNFETIKQG